MTFDGKVRQNLSKGLGMGRSQPWGELRADGTASAKAPGQQQTWDVWGTERARSPNTYTKQGDMRPLRAPWAAWEAWALVSRAMIYATF